MLFTPSLIEAMLNAPNIEENFASFKCLVLCGEVVTVSLRNKIREKVPSARIHNLYSISECHDASASGSTPSVSTAPRGPLSRCCAGLRGRGGGQT